MADSKVGAGIWSKNFPTKIGYYLRYEGAPRHFFEFVEVVWCDRCQALEVACVSVRGDDTKPIHHYRAGAWLGPIALPAMDDEL